MCGWCGDRLGASDDEAARGPHTEPGGREDGDTRPAEAGSARERDDAVDFDRDDLDPVELRAGTMLMDRYRIEAVLGRGGFGITYRARDERLDRAIAIKELFPLLSLRRGTRVVATPENREAFEAARVRFRREATALARFNHPGIVSVFEVFETNDTVYLVMELIEGSSMGEVLRDRGEPLAVEEVLDVVLRAGRALEAVHEAGMLHRDINPSNIMLDGSRRIVLIDFGLARRYGDDISGSLTRAVTPGYAPPEQYAGSARSGPPCDVYGLAATAYKLLTGVTPTNVFDRQAGTPLPAPADLRSDLPPLVSAAVLDGMELEPGHRPMSAQALLNRLGLADATPPVRALVSGGGHRGHDAAGAGAAGRAVSPVPVPSPAPAEPPRRVQPDEAVANSAAGAPRPHAASAPGASPPVPAQVRDLHRGTSNPAFAPWHDGSPSIIGPAARWRGWVTWPVGIAAVALTSASPLVVGAILAFGILPALATAGDLAVHRHRQKIGAQQRRWHDASSGVVSPVRFVRNVAVGALRAVPAMALAAVGVAAESVLTSASARPLFRDWVIRLCGIAVAAVLLVPARNGGRSFRTDLGSTAWATWAMEQRRRPGWRAVTIWVVALAIAAFGAWLDPELWPLT